MRILRRRQFRRSQTAATVGVLAALLFSACQQQIRPPAKPDGRADAPPALAPLAPSPRLIVGRLLAMDAARGFAFVEVSADAPEAALAEGTELIVRTLDLQETARLRTSRYVRGRTLGATILAGQPTPGDEVVWLVP